MDRMNIRTLLILALVVPQLASCVKDDLYNTPHPDKGAVRVTTDWSGASSDAVLPQGYILRIGTEEQAASGTCNAFNTVFEPGRKQLLVYNQAEGITVIGTAASVNTLADGTLTPMPGYLFTGAEEMEIVKDDTLRVTVKMVQRVRTLNLVLKLNPGDETRITSVSATLAGIASAAGLRDGTIAAGGKTVIPTFAIATDNGRARSAGQPALVASLRMMGVASGERQTLALTVTLSGGTVQTIRTDLTGSLKDFGKERAPLTLDAALELPAEGSFGGTITDWTVVDNGDVTIH